MKFAHTRAAALAVATLSIGLLSGCSNSQPDTSNTADSSAAATTAPAVAPAAAPAKCTDVFNESVVGQLGADAASASFKEVKATSLNLTSLQPGGTGDDAFKITSAEECSVGTGANQLKVLWVAFDNETRGDFTGPLLADHRFAGRQVPVPNYGLEGLLEPGKDATLQRIAVAPNSAVIVSGGALADLHVDQLLKFQGAAK